MNANPLSNSHHAFESTDPPFLSNGKTSAQSRYSSSGESGRESGKMVSNNRKRSSQACMYCRRLKMKCSGPSEEGEACVRCKRTGRICTMTNRLERRPWTKKKEAEIQTLTEKIKEMEATLQTYVKTRNSNTSQIASFDALSNHSKAMPSTMAFDSSFISSYMLPKSSTYSTDARVEGFTSASLTQDEPRFDDDDDLYLLVDDTQCALELASILPFVSTGKISATEALSLFNLFMTSCAMHTVLLDPEWHTFPRVCGTSHFLFACIVFIASAYDRAHPELCDVLHSEMNELIGKAVTEADKSIESIQGFLLLYFWNRPAAEPTQDRAWLFAGIAIRLAVETSIGEKPSRFCQETGRQRINRERTWIMTFVVDRSLSASVGKPWTIRSESPLIDISDSWYEQRLARPWDLGISGLASLLKVTCHQMDVLQMAIHSWAESDEGQSGYFACEAVMRIMNSELEQWRRRWYEKSFFTSPNNNDTILEGPTPSSCDSSVSVQTETMNVHLRTLHYITKQASLRYNYSVLILNSYGLQYCATRPQQAQTRTYCISRAISAAQGLVKAARDGLRHTLAFSPQTQYTILSFGIISLIKLAFLRPYVDGVVEEHILKTVQSTINFLDSVAMDPAHTSARLASLIRMILRRRKQLSDASEGSIAHDASHQNGFPGLLNARNAQKPYDKDPPTFPPGMEVHNLPQRSSRAVSPQESFYYKDMARTSPRDCALNAFEDGIIPSPIQNGEMLQNNASQTSRNMQQKLSVRDNTSILSGNKDQSLPLFDLFGTNELIGMSEMTADQILDDSFWLKIP